MCEANLNDITNKYLKRIGNDAYEINSSMMEGTSGSVIKTMQSMSQQEFNNQQAAMHNHQMNSSLPEIDSSFTPFNPQLRHIDLDNDMEKEIELKP